ncbi:hypothetical protein Pfo_031084 [Paulownia fortunei]|nr:hypothetical protein Pfo_031084 [Paulownia fortunei]
MATASNSSSAPIQAQNSPRSRQSRRSSTARGIPSPSDRSPPPLSLSGVVDHEQFLTSSSTTSSDSFPSKEGSTTMAATSSSAEDGSASPAGADAQLENNENGGVAKKPAWNKPSNGATAEIGAVMGAESWPALSESARASPKSSSTFSPNALSHGSITVPQEMAVGSLSSPKEVSTSISTPNSTSNHVVPSCQRSMKRGGGSSSHSSMPANDSLSQAPPTQDAVVEATPPNPGKSSGLVGESSRDNTYRDAGQRGGSYGGNELQPQRSSFRRNNSGPLSRGDGSHHHSHGGRRDQERGKQDWGNPHRSFGSRESHAPQQRVGSRPFLRGPAPNAPFIPPPPSPVAVRPFVSPVVYTEMPSPVFYVPGPHPDSLRPMPMVPISSMFFPMPDPYLHSKIVNQIDYYFSNENLVKDTFLRQNMDGEGWVSIKLIAGFKKNLWRIKMCLDVLLGRNNIMYFGGHFLGIGLFKYCNRWLVFLGNENTI